MRLLQLAVFILVIASTQIYSASSPERVVISKDNTGFVHEKSGRQFLPWGVNYDHDAAGRLLEDYWVSEWHKIEEDFGEIKALGANVVRIHLQFGKFVPAKGMPDPQQLRQLKRLLDLASTHSLHIDLTGLGCYHKQDIPAWYDPLPEKERWAQQAVFWEAIAKAASGHPALFCYDLMNEPVVRAGTMKPGEWLGPGLGDKFFVQYISDDPQGRKREDIAVQWIRMLKNSIRKHDKKTLVTVGLVDWSLNRPRKLYSGFAPEVVSPELDFLAIHLYPETGKLEESLETLKAFEVGKPVLIEETFALKCSIDDFKKFMQMAKPHADGWISFYWGKTQTELAQSKTMQDALILQWLNFFSAAKSGSGQE